MRLKDQVAVITGGAQGICKAIATLFASEGAKLVLSDIDEAMVQATAAQIGKDKNVETLGVKGNVSQIADCEKLVDASLDKFSRIDILINNAGITRDNLLMRMSDDEWDAPPRCRRDRLSLRAVCPDGLFPWLRRLPRDYS